MDIVHDFILWLEAERRYSPLTVRNYRRDVYDLLRWKGMAPESFDPKKIDRTDIEEWMEYLYDVRGLKTSSVNRTIASIRSFWHWMVSHNITSKDITKQIHRHKQPRRLPTFVPDQHMRGIVERMREDISSTDFEPLRNALIIMLLYSAGLRLSEIVAANIEDVASDYSTIRVVGKGDKMRLQPITTFVGKIIKKYFSLIFSQNICTGRKNALILSKKGERISRRTVQRIVDNILKEEGVQGRTSPHVLRHTFATHLLVEGCDLREIQELLGHSSLRATQVYTHVDIRKLQEIYTTAHPRGADNDPAL
ncbi:MAG: tyrosine-type recombinase/integrase [Alistipes sp.]|nr:tyrosine-type recombinase/integrase [Alistipes sp.]